jgi:hypothetical protein
MNQPIFDIFAGTYDKAVWIEAVEGLSNARERMEQIGKEKPGRYFLFSCPDHLVLARIETFEKHGDANKSKAA